MFRCVVLIALISLVSGFIHSNGVKKHNLMRKYSSNQQEVQDLNLEEMFDVFEAADKTVSSSEIPKGQSGSKFDFKKQVGSSAPLQFFDPLGFTADVTEEQYKLYQESEIKHGRVAMVAFVGLVANEIVAPNGIFGKIDGPAIYQFQQTYTVVPVFWQITLAICGLIEAVNIMKGWQPLEDSMKEPSGLAKLKPSYIPGTLGFDPLGFAPTTPKGLETMKLKELNNGRLCMIAVAGCVAQELVTNKSIF